MAATSGTHASRVGTNSVAHVGGGFLFLAIHAVFGEILKHHKALVLTNFAIGFAAIGILTLLLRLL